MPRPFALLLVIGWSVGAIVAMTWGTTYNWPDYLHVTYGFPLAWGIHTLDTIAGPVDKWWVDYAGLGGDLLFWLAPLAVGAWMILVRPGR